MSPRRLVGLYPAPWRARYGDEFLALLEDRPPTLVQLLDIVMGALDAHFFPQAPEGRFRMFTRIAGLAALGAGLALVVGFVGIFGIRIADGEVNRYTVPAFYTLALIGLVGVHLRQATARPVLAWLGFAAAFIGLGWGIVTVMLSATGVLPPTGGEFGYLAGIGLWVGSVVLGATMLAIGVFPMPVGLALTVSAPLGMIGLLVRSAPGAGDTLQLIAQVAIVAYALAWMGIGISLLAAQPREGVLGPAT